MDKNIHHFPILKSEFAINNKNFVGFSDSDYNLVNQLNQNDSIDLAVKNNLYIGSSIITSNDKKLSIISDSVFNGDITTNNIFIKNNAFFNKNIIINNGIILPDEIINLNDFNIDYNNKLIDIITYKSFLANIIDNTSNISNNLNNNGLIQFVNTANTSSNNSDKILTQSILSVNKKFLFNIKQNDFFIDCYLLAYVLKVNNKIITVKPILDTFVILDDNYIIYKIFDSSS